MSSAMTSRETNRLHRWAMWRMTVNEGIISCIRENGTTRVIYPESNSDSDSTTSEVTEFHEFPFITPEQMSLARKLNLREKYGSNHGLSDDAYFIFGLPRISIGKGIPEVTSTGTRSVYESFSEMGDVLSNNNTSQGVGAAELSPALNQTYSELPQTPDALSLISHDDAEIQRINGYREEVTSPASSVPRLTLHNIWEERNNNALQEASRYSSNRYHDHRDRYPENSASHFSERATSDRYPTNRNSFTPSPCYNSGEANSRFSLKQYNMNVESLLRPRQEVYPPVPYSRQHNHSLPRQTSPSPPSPARHSYYSSFPASQSGPGRQTYSSSAASPVHSSFPWADSQKTVGSPGYGNKMRPTTLLSDGDSERLKRQAYYDWTTPTRERPAFTPFSPYS